ncbi:hypothetical protein CEXT_460161 [Caerostris extrusa]|uniref:Uncharacterized protein n=1 Tax=Caerostris extrusa TaxID=172846 RepID=A0AAV4WGN4_CAEEX|nr:hypothetical protein CEXT_460161 [Caerostris extrusa]
MVCLFEVQTKKNIRNPSKGGEYHYGLTKCQGYSRQVEKGSCPRIPSPRIYAIPHSSLLLTLIYNVCSIDVLWKVRTFYSSSFESKRMIF